MGTISTSGFLQLITEFVKALMVNFGILMSWFTCTVLVALQRLLLSTAPTVYVPITVILFVDPVTAGLILTVVFGVGSTELDGLAGTVQVIATLVLLLMPFNTMLGSLQLSILKGSIKSTFGAMVFWMMLIDSEDTQLLVRSFI